MNSIAPKLLAISLALNCLAGDAATESPAIVCGLIIYRSALVKTNITPIREESIRSRIDSERFDACPYLVSITIKETIIHIDFMSEPVNEDISADSNSPIYAGPFVLLNGTWKMLSGKAHAESDVKIKIVKRNSETLIQSSRHRVGSSDDCVDFLLVGPIKSATGSACSKFRSSLDIYREHLFEFVTFQKSH